MNGAKQICDLCGLRLRDHTVASETPSGTFYFCCMGCRQVFAMLMESADGGDPDTFKDTDIFKQCQAMGIIPKSQEDLDARLETTPSPQNQTLDPSPEPPADDHLPVQLDVHAMWCPACAWIIERGLTQSPGISHARCDFATDRLSCRYDPRLTSPEGIIKTVSDLGYQAQRPGETPSAQRQRQEFTRFAISAFLTMNVMMLSFALYSGFFTELPADAVAKISIPIFVLATIVLFYGGGQILKRFWSGLFHGSASMETLISVGALCAYGYSVFSLSTGSIHLYFDTASMLITLVLLGKTLERRAKNRVQEGISSFFSLQPNKVRLCTEAFPQGRFVALDAMQVGDRFRVEPNEVIPADGVIVEGAAGIDESSLTGESVPQKRGLHDHVRSGTTVRDSSIEVRAEAVGSDATLGQMKRVLERVLGEKTQLEGKTDRILRWFVPIMITLAALTAVVTHVSGSPWEHALIRAVSVLVVSCPCALGVAIPLARVAGISVAGKCGVLVRDFLKFEQALHIDTVVFDKTGTITRGAWRLVDIKPAPGHEPDRILAMAAGLEAQSDHLIAREISRKAREAGVSPCSCTSPTDFASGISGTLEGVPIEIGSLARDRSSAPVPQTWRTQTRSQPHWSYVGLWVDGEPAGLFVFGDEARPEAAQVIANLHARNLQSVLLSGDGDVTTQAMAKQLSMPRAMGQQTPEQKAAFVADLQRHNHLVAMVGDGINDAHALAQADLAIAVHSGASLDKEISHLTLMRDDLTLIPRFFDLARKVDAKIHQNLWFSFVYNAIAIPTAMLGFLSPLVAVSAMLLSSLTVIGNTLHLIRSKA